jgi:hypothetical protein
VDYSITIVSFPLDLRELKAENVPLSTRTRETSPEVTDVGKRPYVIKYAEVCALRKLVNVC